MNNDNNDDLEYVNFTVDSEPEEVPEPLDSKGILSFAFDHIYAITPENFGSIHGRELGFSDTPQSNIRASQLLAQQAQLEVDRLTTSLNSTQTEVQKLKALISAHLDLIQKQSDIIATKEKQVKAYIVENDLLKMRLERCGLVEDPSPLLTITDNIFATPEPQSLTLPFPEGLISAPSTSGYVYSGHTSNKPETMVKPTEQSVKTTPSVAAGRQPTVPQSTGGQMYSSLSERSGTLPQAAFGCYGEQTNTYQNTMAASSSANLDVKPAMQYGFNTQPKTTKGGKAKSSKKPPSNKNVPLQFTPSSTYSSTGELAVKSSPNSRKKSAESAYIKKNYGMEKTSGNLETNPFRKIETSCRDFSYGESISIIGSNILSNIERANNAPSGSSPFNLWQMSDDDAPYKNMDYVGKEAPRNVTDTDDSPQPKFELRDCLPSTAPDASKKETHGKGKGKKTKKGVVPENTPRNDTNDFVRCMFLADISADQTPPQPPKATNKKKVRQNIYDCDPSDNIMNLDMLHKKDDVPKRGTSPSASVYSFEDSQDTKVTDSRKLIEPRLSVTESLNRMGKRRSRAFGVFGDNGNDNPVAIVDTTFKSVACYMDSNSDSTRKKMPIKKSIKCLASTSTSMLPIEDKSMTTASKGRKRAQSTSSRVSAVSQTESASSVPGITETKNLFKNKSLTVLSAVEPYYTPVGTPSRLEKQQPINTLEVPKWRIRRVRPQTSYQSENEENVDDSVFHKRHGKMEIEERRIKRWDFQRLKEQLHLKKLKERQEKLNPGGKKLLYRPYKPRRVIPQSLWQTNENALAIEVTDDLPVTSFGELVPSFKPRKFHLPWIPKQKGKKKSKGHRADKKIKAKED